MKSRHICLYIVQKFGPTKSNDFWGSISSMTSMTEPWLSLSESTQAVLIVAVCFLVCLTNCSLQVPFQKVCRQNDTCIAELDVDFNFTYVHLVFTWDGSGEMVKVQFFCLPFRTATLLVAEESYFNITITLSNHGDDSYNTNLSMYYPESLSFTQMTLIQVTKDSTTSPTKHHSNLLEHCSLSVAFYSPSVELKRMRM